jgi:hypothetical protein
MLAVFFAAWQSVGALLAPDRHAIDWHARAFFSVTPVAFGALVWLASVAWRERLLNLATWRITQRQALSRKPRQAWPIGTFIPTSKFPRPGQGEG